MNDPVYEFAVMLKKDIIPHIALVISNDLFEPGREEDLLYAVIDMICERVSLDEIPMSEELKKKLLCDICSCMPAFKGMTNRDVLVNAYLEGQD